MMKALYMQGISIKEIARRTGRDRKTVAKYVHGDSNPPAFKKPEGKKPSILDPYKGYIQEKVKDSGLNAVRLFEDIQTMGYTGKYTIVKDYARVFKKEKTIEAVYRYETKPGVQGQVDWSEYDTKVIDGMERTIYGFSMVLGYSRAKYVEFTLDTTTPTFIKCHNNAFAYYRGCPKEILYDNTKNVVIRRALMSSKSVWNPLFEDFFTRTGFIPRLCRPYWAETNGYAAICFTSTLSEHSLIT